MSIRILVAVLVFGFPAAAYPGRAAAGDCSHTLREQAMVNSDRVLLLMAAGTLFPEGKPIADGALGEDWWVATVGQLAAGVDPDSLAGGESQLCAWLDSRGDPERGRALNRIRQWVDCYRLTVMLSDLVGVESLGSAVANFVDTRPLFPRSDEAIKAQGLSVGASLASGEILGLWTNLATLLAEAPRAERARMVAGLLDLGRRADREMDRD